ncbi:GH35 family endo-1,4-beta-xylanase [Paenibacillus cellulosilyticus]|uniref:Beta-xylanase n=1 Tax=Paenibacillus cellulosilyticus TaxID=375489 RepID=A0A2V2YR26_9BACL|nr:endo-1,4-beta-xylanase [Paenibacillus cellulosilyticus]PWV99508.1 GH35 family endo-1,4-beta-xylanase [Paenibacillus cellulosilyticus]QKS44761.1 endo-1,4-beta-xylanase [Paenibacillus cellulosilyticus]
MPAKPLPTVPGVHVVSTAYGDGWSGANIILGLDNTQWPFSSSTEGDVVAFTPVKDAKYHLTFNATSTGANGYRVRWITGNENGGYTGGDAAVVSDAAHTYAAGTLATTIPGSFTSGVVKDEASDYAVDFVMSGSEVANGLIGNIGIRGTAGSNDFTINSLTITDDNGNVLVEWSSTEAPFVPDDYEWPASKWDLTTLPSLKDAYSNYFLIGNILGWGSNADATPWGQENDQADPALKDASIISQTEAMFKAQYNVVTPENVMKPENISKAANTYDYTAADKLIAWSKANNIAVHAHTLVWHQQSPAWLNKGDAANRASAKANLESYIANVAGHFKGEVISWDVVNEAFSDNTSTFDGSDWRTGLRKDSPWYIAYESGADASKGESGADYIYDAYVAARLADPDATLYYNDYNETYKFEEIAQMAESLNEKWATDSRNTDPARKLVEGIGMQSHFWVGQDPDVDATEVETTIARFVQAGLRISVSELDISFAANNNYHLDEARQAQQAALYGTLFEIYKKYADNIDRVTFWGKADLQSWRSSGMPLLFDNSYAPKAAFWTVIGLGDTTSSGGSESGSGSGSGSSSGGGSVISYVPSVTEETSSDTKAGQVTIKPKVEMKDGAAAAVVSNDDLTKAWKQAAANAKGKKQVTVEIAAQAGATSYGVQLPAASLSDSGASVISVKTDKATIDIPSNMLAKTDIGAADHVTIRVSDVSTAALNEAVRQQIGDRPVINLEVLVDGSVISWNDPNAPITVSIPYKPTAEELLNPDQIIVWYVDGSGQVIPVPNSHYDAAAGTVVFTTTHFSNYAVAFVVKTFGDIQSVTWAKPAIEAMAARGIITGTTDTTFAPQANIKRADFLVLLVRALELKGTNEQAAKFDDVNESDYYYDAVNIARQLGIVNGTGDNRFNPNSSISRQDMMVLAARAAAAAGKSLQQTGSLSAFGDASKVAAYAQDSVAALVTAGIVQGNNGKLAPQSPLTRAEAAVILYRLWSK